MIRTIVDEVLRRLHKENFTSEQLQRIEGTLHLVLSKYDIASKSTAVQTVNGDWRQYLDYFLNRKGIAGQSQKTIELYDYHLSRMFCAINKDVRDISEIDLVAYLEMYRQSRKVSNVYLDNIRICIHTFFDFAYKKGLTSKNPADGVEKIKSPKELKKAYSDEELERIRRCCEHVRDKAIIEFLYSTGVRVSELCALNVNDIDFMRDEVVVMGKGSKERTVYMSKICRMYLKEYIDSRDDDNPALFISLRKPHKRVGCDGIQAMLKTIGKKANVDDCHPHRFRRTMATNLLRKGMPIEEVQVILGHEKIETTLIYTDVSKESAKSHHKKYMTA